MKTIDIVHRGARSDRAVGPRQMGTSTTMRGPIRAMASAAPAVVVSSCALALAPVSPASKEYAWALSRGGCDCGPAAFALGSTTPSWLEGENFANYVGAIAQRCASRQFVVAAFGDGDTNSERNLQIAQARAKPFVRPLNMTAGRRIDTLTFGGPHLLHPSTLSIVCPTDRLPPQRSFQPD